MSKPRELQKKAVGKANLGWRYALLQLEVVLVSWLTKTFVRVAAAHLGLSYGNEES
jgi:hypothetical protein